MTEATIEPGDERIDWRGEPIDCGGCVHCGMRDAGGCRAGHACVEDRYARRIDRFFDWNPHLGTLYVAHPHFEVRAIAAKHADIFKLPGLLNDPEEAVRWNAVRRLPPRYKKMLRHDPHREVRTHDRSVLRRLANDGDALVAEAATGRLAELERAKAEALP